MTNDTLITFKFQHHQTFRVGEKDRAFFTRRLYSHVWTSSVNQAKLKNNRIKNTEFVCSKKCWENLEPAEKVALQ